MGRRSSHQSGRQRSIPEHFKRDGKPKRGMLEDEAKVFAHVHGMNAYPCTFCGKWHVGG
jgi:hypothetical protein